MVRLILDAHVSGPVVGEALRREGHDVFPVDQRPDLEGLSDKILLALAVSERRILVTANVRHFLPLLTEMGVRGEAHPGCILISRSAKRGLRSDHIGCGRGSRWDFAGRLAGSRILVVRMMDGQSHQT